ncbi:MAG: ATP-binding cassette domain-containing protein [Clostridiales bacterium]|nr:ATP-binding cassette domain-containing protein [Candidatus Crickella merdequi]
MNHTIELRKVSKYYAGESGVSMGFARLDLALDMGEFVAITGESGSGKSTLLNVISGLDTYDEGEMFVCGEDTTAFQTEEYERYRKTYIGNIFQDFNLVNSYTVYQNIELVMLMCGKKASECGERINELIELVGLTEYSKTKASKLSGGQKQRVAIARALAKDAPVIVADEPTGNLDSESARVVMETLSRVSKDRLVVIVTHNYEQAEPFVTRKLTMHDGRIIEDKRIVQPEETEVTVQPEAEDMRKGSEIRLGLRNTFNLPAKLILLFIVYLFVSTAVLSQYASAKNSQHSQDVLGYNQYFTDTSAERILVTKPDRTAMTEEDIAKVASIDNIGSIVRNDLAIDQQISLQLSDYYIDATVYPSSQLKKSQLTYGRLPEADNEIVIYSSSTAWDYDYLKGLEDKIINQTGCIGYQDDSNILMLKDKLVVVGIILDDSSDGLSISGASRLYMTETESDKLKTRQMAYLCKTTVDYNGSKIIHEGGLCVLPSASVPKGKAYISEDLAMNYQGDKVVDKPLAITVTNSYFADKLDLKVGKVFEKKNVASVLGISKESYDSYTGIVFVNDAEYNNMFNKGIFQISAYMEDETAFRQTTKALEEAGFKAFLLKDSLTDFTGGFSFVITLLQYASLIIEFIVLFFIAYAVIRLIMKSRNSYYSTLRILGANKKNTDSVLRIELLLVMFLAYAVDMSFVIMLRKGIISLASLRSKLNFLSALDYVILLVVLMAMSLLIARRYSRKIFTKSAMNSYRGEV